MDAGTGTTVPHILILEDDTALQDLVLRAFRKDPDQLRVSVAGTIHDARDIIGCDPPDLIIADWMLPDGKGIEILPRRDGMVTVPLVIMTSHGDERLAVEIMKSGAIDYVVKSATVFRDLPNIARRALRDWDNIRERQRAEEAVRDSQKRLADILSFLPDAVLAIDNEGRAIAWNKAIEEMTGVAAADMLGKGDHEYSIPFYGERRPILIDLVLMEDTEIEKKYDYIQRDGTRITSETFIPTLFGGKGAYLWGTASPLYDATGNRIGAIEVIRDITERKRAEEVLVESEERYRSLLDHVPELILVHQNGIILYTNPAAVKTLGYQPYEALNRRVTDFIAPEFHERVAAAVRRRMSGETVEPYEIDVMGKDGSRRRMIINGTQIEFEGVSASLIILVDITDRKRAEEALRESESFNRGLVENLPDYIAIYGPAGNILHVNPASATVLGYSAEKLVGTPVLSYVAEEYRDEVVSRIIDRREGGKVPPYEIDLLTHDGLRRSVIVKGTQIQYRDTPATLLVLTDITERKRAEEALKTSQIQLAEAMDLAYLVNWEFDVATGIFTFDNRFYALYGTTAELEGGNQMPADVYAKKFVHPDDQYVVADEVNKAIQATDPGYVSQVEHRIIRRDGEIRHIVVRFGILKDENGRTIKTHGANQDITDRRLMESEIRSLNTALEQRIKDRTESLSKANEALEEENTQRQEAEKKLQASYDEKVMLLKEIHHRVKNNLQIIASLLNLQSRYIKDESTLAAIRESQNRVKAMALVHEKLYRAEDIAHISLQDYIRFLGTGLFQFYDAKSRGIQFTLEIHDVNVDIDAAIPLGLILNELISNSLKYAFPEGRKGEIAISVKKEDHTMTILFRDTGIGIPADLDWRNTRSLGLRLVNTLVEQMNGTVELDRSAGTLFTMVVHEKEQRGQ